MHLLQALCLGARDTKMNRIRTLLQVAHLLIDDKESETKINTEWDIFHNTGKSSG